MCVLLQGTLLGLLGACNFELSLLKSANRVMGSDGIRILGNVYRSCAAPVHVSQAELYRDFERSGSLGGLGPDDQASTGVGQTGLSFAGGGTFSTGVQDRMQDLVERGNELSSSMLSRGNELSTSMLSKGNDMLSRVSAAASGINLQAANGQLPAALNKVFKNASRRD